TTAAYLPRCDQLKSRQRRHEIDLGFREVRARDRRRPMQSCLGVLPSEKIMTHPSISALLLGATIMMSQAAMAAPDAATDPNIDPQIRIFLRELNKDNSPFWEKPGPEVRATLTGLQARTPVDVSGVTIFEKTIISEDGQHVKLHVVKPEKLTEDP